MAILVKIKMRNIIILTVVRVSIYHKFIASAVIDDTAA